MTTLSAMRASLIKAGIIAALLALLGGCSTLRFAYGNAPQLAWWWLDGYVDFSNEQTPRAKDQIDRFFEWHRTTQLPDYAALLAAAQADVLQPATPAQACRWQQLARDRLEPALDKAVQMGADLLPGLGEAQFRHIERRFAKGNDEMKRDYLQADAEDRRKAAVERTLERVEQLYGRASDAQRRVVAEGVAASPFDPQAWLGERLRRQRETVQTLRRLASLKGDRDQVVAGLRALVERAERSADPDYRAYQVKLAEYNCAFAARIHTAATPEQRAAARDRLKGWEEDLRALAGGSPQRPVAALSVAP